MRGVTILYWSYNRETKIISTHTPHARRDIKMNENFEVMSIFQLTRLMRGVTYNKYFPKGDSINFNSHASCEAWLAIPSSSPFSGLFQLTRLMRGVTSRTTSWKTPYPISTHTPHARRDVVYSVFCYSLMISTHTPHARRDLVSR